MDLLYAGNVEGFAIVSSDSDFTRLATRLRESGMTVYGLGRQGTPRRSSHACDRFIYLELLGAAAAASPGRGPGGVRDLKQDPVRGDQQHVQGRR